MLNFIERLFIKRNQRVHKYLLKHCERVERYIVCHLWTTKLFFTMPEYEYMNYEEIWLQSRIKWIKCGWLILIK